MIQLETKADPNCLDVTCLRQDFPGSVDFRVERLRRCLQAGRTPESLMTEKRYARGDLADAQYFMGRGLTLARAWDDQESKLWYRAAADRGHIAARNSLLWQSAGRNWNQKIESLRRALEDGDEQAIRTWISIYRNETSTPLPAMVEYLHQWAARGEALAQLYLADGYAKGCFAMQRDPEKAFGLYLLAAQQGNAEAQCAIGIHYALGKGVQQNDVQAVHWYREAARNGDAEAMAYLGYSYRIGRAPLKQSMQEANRWYRRAALRGVSFAQCEMGLSYLHGRELPQNYTRANSWFARAARGDHVEATFELAQSYFSGRGIARSYSNAANLYGSAAHSGHASAQCNFAYMLQTGLGVETNLFEGSRWYRAASEQGLAVAQDNLAAMYMDGSGVEKDLTEAVKWRRKAAEQGLASAQYNLAWMYLNGVGVDNDLTMALRWCYAAAEQNFASAQSCLAWMYENGVGVNKSLDEAIAFYRLAAAQGDELGIQSVARLVACRANPRPNLEPEPEPERQIPLALTNAPSPIEEQEVFSLDQELLDKHGRELDAVAQQHVPLEFKLFILPALTARALRDGITAQQYESRWRCAWRVTHRLFEALHKHRKYPECFWQHQPIEFFENQYLVRGINIRKDFLLDAANLYLRSPDIRTNRLDWIFLDALVLTEVIARSDYAKQTLVGISSQLAVEFEHSDIAKYYRLRREFWIVGFVFNYVAWPTVAYELFVNERRTWALATAGLWVLFQVVRIVIGFILRRERHGAIKVMQPLWNLYSILGGRTISPRKLKEALDSAAAVGIVFDGAAFSIVDRIIARDVTAFIPTQ